MEIGANNSVNFNGNFDKSISEIIKGRAKKVDLEQKPDTVEFSDKNKKKFTLKRFVTHMAVFYAAAFALTALVSIGRDPAKAAKVLRGTSEIVNPAYKKGAELMQSLTSKTGPGYKVNFDDILQMFKPEKNSTKLGDALDEVEVLIQKQGLEPDEKVLGAISALRENLQKHTSELQSSFAKGERVSVYDKSREFENANKNVAGIIEKFLDDFRYDKMDFQARYSDEGKAIDELRKFFGFGLESAARPKQIIGECPKEILDTSQTLYHGTTAAGKVYKNGFTPYVSNQLSTAPRELGAGIYLTSDEQVAATFCRFKGNIIPIKLDSDTKVAFVDENIHRAYTVKALEFLTERIPKSALDALPADEKNAMIELLYQKAFIEAGFDAAYIPKGVQAGFNLFGGNINEAIGTNQSQIILFAPEKLEITSRGLKERIMDLGAKLKASFNVMKYAKEHPLIMLGI